MPKSKKRLRQLDIRECWQAATSISGREAGDDRRLTSPPEKKRRLSEQSATDGTTSLPIDSTLLGELSEDEVSATPPPASIPVTYSARALPDPVLSPSSPLVSVTGEDPEIANIGTDNSPVAATRSFMKKHFAERYRLLTSAISNASGKFKSPPQGGKPLVVSPQSAFNRCSFPSMNKPNDGTNTFHKMP